MSNDDQSIIESLSVARTGNLVSEFEYLRVFDAELDDPPTEATVYTLAPEVDDSDVSEAFRRAAVQWGNASSHPNVVTVFDHGTDPRQWIAVEKVEGERLESAQQSLSRKEVRTVIEDTAEALRNAALYNTIHLALSPACVWIVRRDGRRRAVVDDWGLHLAVRRAAGDLPPNEYLAPEILAGENADKRADVYGLGLVSYYALTGRSPPSGEGEDDPNGNGVDLAPPSAVDESLPTAVDDVILRSISTDPEQRQQSSFEFKQEALRTIPERSDVDSGSESSESANTGADDEIDGADEKRDGPQLTDISGVGERRAARLREAGYETPADLATASKADLQSVDDLGTAAIDRIYASDLVKEASRQVSSDDEPISEATEPPQEEHETSDSSIPTTGWMFLLIIGTALWWGPFLAALFVFPEGTEGYEASTGLMAISWFIVPPSLYLDSRTVRRESDWGLSLWLYLLGSLSVIGTGLAGLVYLRRRRNA